jgi:hypothetical protein
MRQNPIPGLLHFPGDNGISSLIGLPQISPSQIEKKEKSSNGEDDKKIFCPYFHEFNASLESPLKNESLIGMLEGCPLKSIKLIAHPI